MRTHTLLAAAASAVVALGALTPTAAQAQAEVRIDLADAHQSIEGFGGALITWDGEHSRYTPEFFDYVVKDLGVTLVRMPIHDYMEIANDDADPNTFRWEGFRLAEHESETGLAWRFGLLNEMKKRGAVRFLASPWTPPVHAKTNRSKRNGGYLRMDRVDEMAEFLAAFVILGKKNYGIDVAAVTLQNELLFNHTFGSAVYTGPQLRELTRAVQRKFKKEGIASRIFLPEDMMEFGRMRDYVQATLADPETKDFPGGFCTHRLGGFDEVRRWRDEVAKPAGRQSWMTETSGHPQTWDGALKLASDMHDYLVGGDFSAWIYWQLSDTKSSGDYALMVDEKPAPKYWAAKHFYRYVRPGAVRVGTTPERGDVLVSAFRHSSDGTLTVVLVNNGDKDAPVRLSLAGGPGPKEFAVYRSTAAQGGAGTGCVAAGKVSLAAPSLTLPAKSITTLHGTDAVLKAGKVAQSLLPAEAWRVPAGAKPGEVWGSPAKIDPGPGAGITEAARTNNLKWLREEIDKGNLNARRGGDDYTALHMALTAGAGDAARLLLERGADVNAKGLNGWTPLHAAAASFGSGGDNPDVGKGWLLEDLVKMVLDRKPEVNARTTDDGWTPLHAAAASALKRDGTAARRVSLLIAAGADVNARDKKGKTPLHVAAWQGQMEWINTIRSDAVRALIAGGANIDATDDAAGRTPLHYAALMGYDRITAALLAAGAKKDVKDKEGRTALDLARPRLFAPVVALLEGKEDPKRFLAAANEGDGKAGRGADAGLGPALVRAAWDGNAAKVKELLAQGADPSYRDGDGFTALQRARDRGHKEAAALLEAVEKKATK